MTEPRRWKLYVCPECGVFEEIPGRCQHRDNGPQRERVEVVEATSSAEDALEREAEGIGGILLAEIGYRREVARRAIAAFTSPEATEHRLEGSERAARLARDQSGAASGEEQEGGRDG